MRNNNSIKLKKYKASLQAELTANQEAIKNFKLKPAEQSLLNLMQDAEKRKKPYQDKIKELEGMIEAIDKQKTNWQYELHERMGIKRYKLYQSWTMRKVFKGMVNLVPVVAMTAIVAGVTNIILGSQKAKPEYLPINIVEEDKPFKDRISGWVQIKNNGLADYYEKNSKGKMIKITTIPFNPLMQKYREKYLLLKSKAQVQP